MNIKTLIIYDYQILYEILTEIKEFLNFKILNTDKKNFEKLELNKLGDYLILRSKNSVTIKNSLVVNNLPIKLDKLIQTININFLKNNFAKKSEIKIGKYILDLNSRKIIFENQYINLTERETDLIIFIKSNNNVTINELQNSFWGYSSELQTHTVETHIYRLRKKFLDTFSDNEFIISKKNGYQIK